MVLQLGHLVVDPNLLVVVPNLLVVDPNLLVVAPNLLDEYFTVGHRNGAQ